MSVVEFLSQPVWQRLGLTLLHFLWQGLAIAALFGLIIRILRLSRGNNQYFASLLAFLVMMACPIATFLTLDIPTESLAMPIATQVITEPIASSWDTLGDLPVEDTQTNTSVALPEIAEPVPSIPLREKIADYLHTSLPWAISAWLVGVFVLSMRLLMGFVGVHRWRQGLEPLPDNPAQRVSLLAKRLGLRGITRVFVSPCAVQAVAIGYFRPMVLLPAAMVTQMPPDMLEAVIAHELAHIRRFDLWVNLLQRVAETLLFYHPAVWWLSNRLRSERELCCDELAIRATGQRLTYASTLEHASRTEFISKQPALAVGLGRDRKPTLNRIRHILGLAPTPQTSRAWMAGLATIIFAVVLASVVAVSCSSRQTSNVPPADSIEPKDQNCKILDPQRSMDYPMPVWKKKFEAVYRLEKGQILKRIAPPFMPEREEYYKNKHSLQASAIPEPPDYFTFYWNGGLKNPGLGFTNGKRPLSSVLRNNLSIGRDKYEGPEELLQIEVPGDWIVRKDSTVQQRLRALERILKDEIGRDIRFIKRQVKREVIVATGNFEFNSPRGTYDDRKFHFYSDKLDPDESAGGGTADSVSKLLEVLARLTGIQVIDNTQSAKEIKLPYRHHGSSYLRNLKSNTEVKEKLALLLKNIELQANLKFNIQLRTVQKWFVVENEAADKDKKPHEPFSAKAQTNVEVEGEKKTRMHDIRGSTEKASPSQQPEFRPYYLADENPEFWSKNLGKTVSVKGVAVRTMIGAGLKSEHGQVWIDDFVHWPKDMEWKIVRVTGTVVKRHDGPVLSKEQLALTGDNAIPGTGPPDGVGYPQGSKELHEARKRYLLKDISYTVIEDMQVEGEQIGSKLEFRVAPDNKDVTETMLNDFLADLAENGPVAARKRNDKFAWFEVRKGTTFNNLITGEYQDRKYLLLHNKERFVMLSGHGWGLKSVYAANDASGRPAIDFEFDKKGAQLFESLTGSNLNQSLAILINGMVYSVPTIKSPIRNRGQIVGIFTEAEVKALLASLKGGGFTGGGGTRHRILSDETKVDSKADHQQILFGFQIIEVPKTEDNISINMMDTATPGVLTVTADMEHSEQLLELSKNTKGSSVLFSPRILANVGEQAQVNMMSELPYVSGYQEADDDSVEPQPIIKYADIGFELSVVGELHENDHTIKARIDFKHTELVPDADWHTKVYEAPGPVVINQISTQIAAIPDQPIIICGVKEDKTSRYIIMTAHHAETSVAVKTGVVTLAAPKQAQVAPTDDTSDPAAIAIIEKVKARYAQLKTYSSVGEVQTDMDMSSVDISGLPETTSQGIKVLKEAKSLSKDYKLKHTFSVKLARPEMYCIEWTQKVHESFSNTSAAWSTGQGHNILNAGQKTSPKDIMTTLIFAAGGSAGLTNNIPPLFFDTGAPTIKVLQGLSQKEDEKIEGEDCYVISGKLANIVITYWISKQTFLIRQSQQRFGQSKEKFEFPEMPQMAEISDDDMRQALKAAGQEATPEAIASAKQLAKEAPKHAFKITSAIKGTITEIHRDVVVDQPIPKEEFVPKASIENSVHDG
jgi:beta-lactamase regulating signal transducer with metallopeptidase domain